MKMPEKLEPVMFAPCGMYCLVCYKHCYHKKPCAGCVKSDEGKPEHCRKCKIKDCVTEQQITYCFECPEYPCKQIKRLEKSYNTRYHASLMENSQIQGGVYELRIDTPKMGFGKNIGFIVRDDLVYHNKSIHELKRIQGVTKDEKRTGYCAMWACMLLVFAKYKLCRL